MRQLGVPVPRRGTGESQALAGRVGLVSLRSRQSCVPGQVSTVDDREDPA